MRKTWCFAIGTLAAALLYGSPSVEAETTLEDSVAVEGIELKVQEGGKLFLEGVEVQAKALGKKLREAFAGDSNASGRVVLRVNNPEGDSVFLRDLLDSCVQAKAQEIALLVPSASARTFRFGPDASTDEAIELNLKPDAQVFLGKKWVPRENLQATLEERQKASRKKKLSLGLGSVMNKGEYWPLYRDLEQNLAIAAAVGFTSAEIVWGRNVNGFESQALKFEVSLVPAGTK